MTAIENSLSIENADLTKLLAHVRAYPGQAYHYITVLRLIERCIKAEATLKFTEDMQRFNRCIDKEADEWETAVWVNTNNSYHCELVEGKDILEIVKEEAALDAIVPLESK